MKSIGGVIAAIIWIMGIVLTKGFWWTTLAVFFPFYAWYITIAHFMIKFGLL